MKLLVILLYKCTSPHVASLVEGQEGNAPEIPGVPGYHT